ncbi:glycosyltransferase family 2 protein [Flavobacterium psychroterrae]|uniref:Glycosyltransferase family 2 protein n=1 Tax=Flavobacterium psychroterrae TaxID=2133767 RepID=A0ABS5PC81_9FLAO|nr:glycosyltransferase family 2 protein [Flavobacterium psychroterrae]MBS7231897.1 glycosyltransferase family 2 protein [Flavobacterium psychroterrae]
MIAIVIPYYKLEFFEATLQSLKTQTDKRFKVYIGNDASPENPISLLDKFKDAFEYSYHYFDSNLGGISLVKQWERCIELTDNEEWIMILGDDDVLSNNVIEQFYNNQEEITNQNINVVRFSTKVINEKGEVFSDKFEHPVLETGQDFLARKFSKKTRSSLSEYLFKKEIVKQKNFRHLPLAWHSDDLAVLEFSMPNFIYSINDAQLLIRVSNLSITGDSSSNGLKNQATFDFVKILFTEYSTVLNKFQSKAILNKLEVAFFNIPSFYNYKTILNYHFKQIGFGSAINFQLRLIKYRIILILKKLNIFPTVYTVYAKIFNK